MWHDRSSVRNGANFDIHATADAVSALHDAMANDPKLRKAYFNFAKNAPHGYSASVIDDRLILEGEKCQFVFELVGGSDHIQADQSVTIAGDANDVANLNRSPRLARQLLFWFAKPEYREDLIDALDYDYEAALSKGRSRVEANASYWFATMRSLAPQAAQAWCRPTAKYRSAVAFSSAIALTLGLVLLPVFQALFGLASPLGERRVAVGQVNHSLFVSAQALGATPSQTKQMVELFANKIDFEQDIRTGDTFKAIFDNKVAKKGHAAVKGNLLYAEIQTKSGIERFYSYQPQRGSNIEFFDENGKNIKGFFLATPVLDTRVSPGIERNSVEFGSHFDSVLGFSKMHSGIDFEAPTGAPIRAAGDGIVEDAKWWGGFGRWVRIQHNDTWETGYANMSAIAVRPGQRVRQGDVIGYVGATGRTMGPRLHFEVWQNHRAVNPRGAEVPKSNILGGTDMIAFLARKRAIDAMIAIDDVKRAEGKRSSQALAVKSNPNPLDTITMTFGRSTGTAH